MNTFMTISRVFLIALVLVFLPVISQQAVSQIANHVVISEVYGGGGNSGATYTHDFIELYNPTGSSVDLTGWSVQYRSATSSATFTLIGSISGSIASHGYFLIECNPGAGGSTPLPAQDDSVGLSLGATAGQVVLANDGVGVTTPTDPNVVDFVGYGSTAVGFEGAGPTATLSNTTSAERKAQSTSDATAMGSGGVDENNGNGWDTNNNSADFIVRAPDPQNSLSPTEDPPVILNIPPIISAVTRVTFIPPTGGTDSVKANITDLDGTITGAKLHVRVNGGTYDSSLTMTILTGSTYHAVIPATKHVSNGDLVEYYVSATDDSSGYSSTASTLAGYFVGDAPISSIKAVSLGSMNNYGAQVNGVINVRTNTFTNGQGFIQDATGGLQMFVSGGLPVLQAGRNARVQGTIINFNNAYELSTPNFTWVDTVGTSSLTPATVTLPMTHSATNANEGKLVTILALTTDSTGTFTSPKNYIYEDGSTDTVTVRVQSNGSLNNLVGRTISASATDVVGILSYSSTYLRVLPRNAVDMGFDPGDGTGTASITPPSRFPSQSALAETLVVTGDGTNTLAGVSVTIPSTWTWDGTSYALSNAGFSGASGAVTGDGSGGNPWVITVSSAAVTNTNTGRIIITNLTSPGTLGSTTFTTRTKGTTGAAVLSPIATSPVVTIAGGFEAVTTGNWNSTSVWSGGVVPGASDDVTMGTLNVVVTITADAQCRNLTMTGSGSASNSGPLLQFNGSGALTLTVNGDLTITTAGSTSGPGGGDRGGRAKLTSNGNSSAILIVKGDISTASSNTAANGHAGLNMNEGTTKLTGATSDSIKNGAGFRLGNLEIGDGTLAKTLSWAPTTGATMNVRSLRVKTNATFWAGTATNTAVSNIGNGSNDTLPHLDGGIIIESGAAFRVQESSAGFVTHTINLDGGGITNNGTFDLHSAAFSGKNNPNIPNNASGCWYNVNFGFTGGLASANHNISGTGVGNFADMTVAATDTVTLNQDMTMASFNKMTLNGTLIETAGNTVHGTVEATRTVATATPESFGGIGAVINAAGSAPGSTVVTRVTEVAQSGAGNNSILRYFDIAPATNTGLNATFEYHYDNSELNGQTAATLSLWKSTNSGGTWSLAGGTADAPNRKVTLSGIDGFSRWTASDASNPLGSAGASYIVNQNWNMVSLPLNVADPNKTVLYPTATSPLYAYEGLYVSKDSLLAGVGYWLKFAAKETVAIVGTPFSLDTVDLAESWNMIGTVTNDVLVSGITEIPGGVVVSSYFGYEAGYFAEDTLKGGKAYWVKAGPGGGQIVLQSSGIVPKTTPVANPLAGLNTVTITDKNGNKQTLYFGNDADNTINIARYELPPVPPAGIADVRFASQRLVETYAAKDANKEYGISLRSMEYPLTVSWNVKPASRESFSLTDGSNGKSVGVKKLDGEGSMTISKNSGNTLVLKVTGSGALPKSFALGANYPNPFNPSTKFQIALPVDAQVEVNVYDILGRKVASLVNDVRPAGFHTIEWNGLAEDQAPVTSGVYFIRMVSGTFNDIQKVMLMK